MEIMPSAGRMMGFPSPVFCVMDYRGTRTSIPRMALQSGVAHNTSSQRLCSRGSLPTRAASTGPVAIYGGIIGRKKKKKKNNNNNDKTEIRTLASEETAFRVLRLNRSAILPQLQKYLGSNATLSQHAPPHYIAPIDVMACQLVSCPLSGVGAIPRKSRYAYSSLPVPDVHGLDSNHSINKKFELDCLCSTWRSSVSDRYQYVRVSPCSVILRALFMDILLNINRLADINNAQIIDGWVMCVITPAEASGQYIEDLSKLGLSFRYIPKPLSLMNPVNLSKMNSYIGNACLAHSTNSGHLLESSMTSFGSE